MHTRYKKLFTVSEVVLWARIYQKPELHWKILHNNTFFLLIFYWSCKRHNKFCLKLNVYFGIQSGCQVWDINLLSDVLSVLIIFFFSENFDILNRNEIGHFEIACTCGFPGFSNIITYAYFYCFGTCSECTMVLYLKRILLPFIVIHLIFLGWSGYVITIVRHYLSESRRRTTTSMIKTR